MELRSFNNIELLIIDWIVAGVLMCMCLHLVGCSTVGLSDPENSIREDSMVLGFVQVEPKGPYFRKHQTEPLIRFFDVRNIKTGERTRLHVEPETERLVTRLAPGEYELFRLQIGEGPFRAEALVNMTFQVYAGNVVYLGIWRFRIDPPKTVRMLQWDVLAENPDWDPLLDSHPEIGDKSVVISLPKPVATQVRLFAVAPSQPRAKYFYRR